MNKIKAAGIYYGQVFPATLICTLLTCSTIHKFGWEGVGYLSIVKIVTTLIAFYFNNVFRANETYFYYNLGIGKWALRSGVFIADTLLFVLILILFFRP